ncbi:Queuine tRNA-ribosyltransferase-like protein [Pleurotus pulmonarius]
MHSISFNLASTSPGTRVGTLTLVRPEGQTITIHTPGLITSTSRGVVPHLSRDHCQSTEAIRWANIPFETFLEQSPPIPTYQTGPHPLHKFLGYEPSRNLLSMSIRDPHDGREMPPNGQNHISAYCVRGVRKVTSSDWRSHVEKCKPDIVFAMSDIPFTPPPYSQKRITKSLERSAAWLVDMLRPSDSGTHEGEDLASQPNVMVHMAGGASIAARKAFAETLDEALYAKEAEVLKPLKHLNDGILGYVFDLIPLRLSLKTENTILDGAPAVEDDDLDQGNTTRPVRALIADFIPLLEASLAPLPQSKLRSVNSTSCPHEVLQFIRDIGIDLFDARWAQRAADIGVALDFKFPLGEEPLDTLQQAHGKRDIGHNLYDTRYAHDFSRLASCFLDGASAPDLAKACACAACSPSAPTSHISHSYIDSFAEVKGSTILPPYSRAYLHHLLHTHEMSSHTLLVMHNITVLDAFFAGIRSVLSQDNGKERFVTEVARFEKEYDEKLTVFDQARVLWAEVERARGKGRLAREKAKQNETTLGTAVELE